MNITLELLSLDNSLDIYRFEVENRAYFESELPSRGDDYYIPQNYNQIIQGIIDEQSRGECYMYAIRNEAGKVVGRVNLTSVQKGEAELGYRIGKGHSGKGIAGKAVQMALYFAKSNHNLQKIIAGTSTENVPSQKVLEKNGFVFIDKVEKYMELNGKWIDNLNYSKIL